MAAAFADQQVMGAKGTFRTEQTGFVPRFVQAEYEDRYDHMRRHAVIDFIDNYSAGYRRQVFLANGGFDVEFEACEDQELSFRLAEKGYRLVFAPQAVVTHLHDTSLAEYMRRKYAQGFWKAPLTHLHPERMVEDTHTPQVLKLQIVLVGLMLVLFPLLLLGLWWPPLDWLWLAELALVGLFLASAAPFLAKLARRSWSLAAAAPLMLAARALALGSGYLVGTIQFAGMLPWGAPAGDPRLAALRQARPRHRRRLGWACHRHPTGRYRRRRHQARLARDRSSSARCASARMAAVSAFSSCAAWSTAPSSGLTP